VQGGIGNAGFIVGDKGVIVIDTTISPSSAKELLADIASITPKPVTAVILTHGDLDHTGGLAAFPANIAIFAQANTLKRMAAEAASGHSPVPADRLPNRTVEDRQSIVLDGVTVDLLHWAPAHTDGDLVIFLPTQKIVFTGDIFCLDQPRALIHLEQQGSSEGWITTAKSILALDATQFVVGHGEVQGKAALEERVKQVVAEKAQIKSLISNGKSLAEIQAAVGDPPAGQATPGPGGPRFAPFSEVVYQEETGKQ
jgi:glyoxylase-like metal-dependent hydrolase (beta-lactamase superfamily II)